MKTNEPYATLALVILTLVTLAMMIDAGRVSVAELMGRETQGIEFRAEAGR